VAVTARASAITFFIDISLIEFVLATLL